MDITYDDIKRFIKKYLGTKKQQIIALSTILTVLIVILGGVFAYNKMTQPKTEKPEIVDKGDDRNEDVMETPTPPTVITPEDNPTEPEKPVEQPKEDLITYGAPYEETREIEFKTISIPDDSLEEGQKIPVDGTGIKGLESRTVRVKYVNGVQVSIEEVTSYKVVKEPVDLKLKIGTKKKEVGVEDDKGPVKPPVSDIDPKPDEDTDNSSDDNVTDNSNSKNDE